jgi:uncharacterized protein (DUF849 family)
VLIKACLNGFREPGAHPALPLSAEELARDAEAVVTVGARALHIHPRDRNGAQSLKAADQAAALSAIRARCPGIPVGVSTAFLIEPDEAQRLQRVREWTILPDFASVNFDEPGTADLCHELLERGIGVEAGLSTVADAQLLCALGLADRCLRILIEVGAEQTVEALAVAAAIVRALDEGHAQAPRLLHGYEDTTWPLVELARYYGYDTRIGLEDTLTLPDGSQAAGNAELVAQAVRKTR